MKEDHNDTCSTGSSLSGIYKNIFKSQTPVCMFYFSHPFGISTPSSSANNCGGVGGGGEGSESETSKRTKRKTRYTTKTYLVTEIQKNQSDGSQDESDVKKSAASELHERDLLPWPKNFLLPPFVQMIEKKHGKKLPDFDAILRQVRKQAWNTPKSHHSHSFWSRGSSISSDDFSSLASPDSLCNDKAFTRKTKLRRKLRNAEEEQQRQSLKKMDSSGGNAGNGHGKAQPFLKRRYSVPEIIMRKYSLAQQKSCEESASVYSCDTITKRNGQSSTAINKKPPIQSHTPPSHTASPIKYFIPLSPQQQQQQQQQHSNVSSSSGNNSPHSFCGGKSSCGGSGGFSFSSHHNTSEISMRKQTLLRRMWSREFQHSKYSGSWSPPLRKATHHTTQSRLKKFNTLPEFISSSCEKCKELGVLARDNLDEEPLLCEESKEDKAQQTDFECDERKGGKRGEEEFQSLQTLSSASSSASTIIQSNAVEEQQETKLKEKEKEEQPSSIKNPSTDSNGNNIIICMTALQERQHQEHTAGESEEMLQVEIDGNNNSNIVTATATAAVTTTTSTSSIESGRDKYLRKQFSTQLEDEGYHPSEEVSNFNYRRLREEKLSETEIDQYISQMLIDNLNNVIRTVNENLQANGEHGLVKIDYNATSEVVETLAQNVLHHAHNGSGDKLRNQHEIAIQMRNAKNGDNGSISKNRNNSNESEGLVESAYAAVERETSENADVKLAHFGRGSNGRHYFVSDTHSSTDQESHEVTAIINTGTSYPHNLNRPETILVPRVIGPKTESMEVNPSSSSAQEDDEFDGMPDSDEEDLSDVDSLDDVVTIRAKKLSELAHQQHKKAQALFRQTHLKGQAFFVPIVDTEQPIDEHIVVADTMPEKLKERLVLRQRRRDLKKQTEMKMKQWRMQKFIERKMEQMSVVNDYLADLSNTGGAFKIIGLSSKQTPIETSVYRRASNMSSGGGVGGGGVGGGGWVPKQRVQAAPLSSTNPSESTSEKSSKSKKLRNEIGMLESYKIDARGNMQIQAPKEKKPPPQPPSKPRIRRTSYTASASTGGVASKISSRIKLKPPSSETNARKSVPSSSSKRATSHIPTSSASSVEAIDARRRQVMKDVQQMSVYKNDLTPDPDSGPSRKMWKTEIQEGDKHIEILEIVECVDGNTMLAQPAPETLNNHNNSNNFNHLFASSSSLSPSINTTTQIHHSNNRLHHLPSSNHHHHPMYVNKTFSVRASGFDDSARNSTYASRIPVPVHRQLRSRHFAHFEPRDSSPSNQHSSSTEAEESLTSAGSSSLSHQPSRVDRMIANLLMEALKSPEELGMDFITASPNMRRSKRRSQSPAGADSSSTGYYTGDSSRRSASNSAGKYHHRFEVIPEEKSSFSVDSSNDDFGEENEEEENEKLNSINEDWKSKKNLQNNDIKTRNSAPQNRESRNDIDEEYEAEAEEEEEEENTAIVGEGEVESKELKDIKEENEDEEEQGEEDEEEAEEEDRGKVKEEERKEEKEEKTTEKSKPSRLSPTAKKSPAKDTLKTPSSTSAKSSPARSPKKSIKSTKSTIGADSSPTHLEKKKQQPRQLSNVSAKDGSETKSFVMFTDENDNGDVFEKNALEDDDAPSTAQKSEDTFHTEHRHSNSSNLIHQFMSNKNSSSSSPSFSGNVKASSNNHYHYHLYQYQTNHCCFNLLDHSKSSSTVTTAASTHDISNFCHPHSMRNACPLGVADSALNSSTPSTLLRPCKPKSTETGGSVKFDSHDMVTILNSGGSTENSECTNFYNKLDNCPPTASSFGGTDATSRMNTADGDEDDGDAEKIIEIELTNETLRQPREDNDDNCSCTKKYLPYKVNEKNVWQVYETSDCKYIHSKHEIEEAFQPPTSGDSSLLASADCDLLHSRSNFSNQIVCHAINHEAKHRDESDEKGGESSNMKSSQASPKSSSLYTPTFNIKPGNADTCRCCKRDRDDADEEIAPSVDGSASKANDDEDADINGNNQSTSIASTRDVYTNVQQLGKLLNRPKATNNISREQVKPVEKEIQREITKNGITSNNTNTFKSSPKPIRLPSPVPKQQQQHQQKPKSSKRNNSYEDNSNSSNESSSSTDTRCESPKHSKASSKQKSGDDTPKNKTKINQENSLIKQESKSVIPNIHQGWSVTVAGTHPDLAPDVEMKICFPKSKMTSQATATATATIVPSLASSSDVQKPESEVFYYKNNQLMPPSVSNQSSNPMSQLYDSKPPYYNHRRSLSLARIDSGLSGIGKRKSYNLPNLHMPRSTARKFKQVECTTISASKTIIPSRRSLSLDVGNRRPSYDNDSRSQASPFTPSEMLSVVGSEIKKTLKPKVKTMSERDLTKRHLNCFTRSNGHIF